MVQIRLSLLLTWSDTMATSLSTSSITTISMNITTLKTTIITLCSQIILCHLFVPNIDKNNSFPPKVVNKESKAERNTDRQVKYTQIYRRHPTHTTGTGRLLNKIVTFVSGNFCNLSPEKMRGGHFSCIFFLDFFLIFFSWTIFGNITT